MTTDNSTIAATKNLSKKAMNNCQKRKSTSNNSKNKLERSKNKLQKIQKMTIQTMTIQTMTHQPITYELLLKQNKIMTTQWQKVKRSTAEKTNQIAQNNHTVTPT